MHAHRRVSKHAVAFHILTQHFRHCLSVEHAAVVEPHLLVAVGDCVVVAHEDWSEPFNPLLASLVDGCRRLAKESVDGFEQQRVGDALFQHRVALFERTVVANQLLQIFVVSLRYYPVDQSSPLLAAAGDKIPVARSDHHKREQPDVFALPAVFLPVAFHGFLLSALQRARNLLRFSAPHILALQQHELFAVAHGCCVGSREAALTETEIENRVEHVGFAHTVVAQQAIHLRGKIECCLGDVLIVQYRQFRQYHKCKNNDFSATVCNAVSFLN